MYYLGLTLKEVIFFGYTNVIYDRIKYAWMDVTIQIHLPILNRSLISTKLN